VYLVAIIARDLDVLQDIPDLSTNIPDFFSSPPLSQLRVDGVDFLSVIERLFALKEDADTYFYCLAILHKARLKYERILQVQPLPTVDQVGPRSLLQYGILSPRALAGFLFWRKWLFDIDNRAGQETGYIFEPIIAYAIGGVPLSARKSPIRRRDDPTRGRQIDCIVGQRAYEIKIRVTIAASGQGRWREELEFPQDCQLSGYTPVLVVLDPTPNPKLHELRNAFLAMAGEAYIGQEAWDHLSSQAGATMARFLDVYVHQPIHSLLREAPEQPPAMLIRMHNEAIIITIDGENLNIPRVAERHIDPSAHLDEMPEDVDDDTLDR
jgi:hypothetical protein